jgi:hypothetical protein
MIVVGLLAIGGRISSVAPGAGPATHQRHGQH